MESSQGRETISKQVLSNSYFLAGSLQQQDVFPHREWTFLEPKVNTYDLTKDFFILAIYVFEKITCG